jgi:hypothetical protein
MQQISTNFLSFIPLVSRIGPDARVLPIGMIDFALDTSYQIDLTGTVQSAQLAHPIQSCFIDASQVPYGNTVLQVFGTGQRIVVPPASQGYYPLLMTTNSAIFTLINGSNINVNISAPFSVFFLNVPFVASQWFCSSAANPAAGGYGVGPLGSNALGS